MKKKRSVKSRDEIGKNLKKKKKNKKKEISQYISNRIREQSCGRWIRTGAGQGKGKGSHKKKSWSQTGSRAFQTVFVLPSSLWSIRIEAYGSHPSKN